MVARAAVTLAPSLALWRRCGRAGGQGASAASGPATARPGRPHRRRSQKRHQGRHTRAGGAGAAGLGAGGAIFVAEAGTHGRWRAPERRPASAGCLWRRSGGQRGCLRDRHLIQGDTTLLLAATVLQGLTIGRCHRRPEGFGERRLRPPWWLAARGRRPRCCQHVHRRIRIAGATLELGAPGCAGTGGIRRRVRDPTLAFDAADAPQNACERVQQRRHHRRARQDDQRPRLLAGDLLVILPAAGSIDLSIAGSSRVQLPPRWQQHRLCALLRRGHARPHHPRRGAGRVPCDRRSGDFGLRRTRPCAGSAIAGSTAGAILAPGT